MAVEQRNMQLMQTKWLYKVYIQELYFVTRLHCYTTLRCSTETGHVIAAGWPELMSCHCCFFNEKLKCLSCIDRWISYFPTYVADANARIWFINRSENIGIHVLFPAYTFVPHGRKKTELSHLNHAVWMQPTVK